MTDIRRISLALTLALLPGLACACGEAHRLEGVLSIPSCDPGSAADRCVPGSKAVFNALEALDIPEVFTVGVQTSPWRMYDAEGRIVTVEDMAAAIRAQRKDSDHSVYLVGSWTAVRPDGNDATLARRLSLALDGYPVDGTDGFLWLSPEGAMRTTRQAFSVWKTGRYSVEPGEDVLVALVPGAWSQFEHRFADEGVVEGVLQAGVGHDVFMLCPERALAAFERAAGMGSAIGAYNAGLMHAGNGDRAAAIAWLQKAVSMGEAKAPEALAALGGTSPGE